MAHGLLVNDVLKLLIFSTTGDQTAVNSMFYRVTGITGASATDQDFVDQMDSVLTGDWCIQMGSNSTYDGVQAYIITSTPLPSPVSATAGAGIGTGGVTCSARQVCGIISWTTDFAGPKYRGRMYMPFPCSAFDTTNGTPSSSYLGYLAAIAVDLQAPPVITGISGTATLQAVINHRASLSTTPITGHILHPRWATQKRRGSYGRTNIPPI